MSDTKMVSMFSFSPIEQSQPQSCETASGKYIDVMNPTAEDICIDDIAWALSRQPRFAGHSLGEIYHVAQHAIFVKDLLSEAIKEEGSLLNRSYTTWIFNMGLLPSHVRNDHNLMLHALCHDNTEAYLVDLPSPIKRHSALRGPYKEIEANLTKAIESALGLIPLSEVEKCAIHWADLMALQIEAANIMPSRGRGWGVMPMFDMTFIQKMPKILTWNEARVEFLNQYHYYTSLKKITESAQ